MCSTRGGIVSPQMETLHIFMGIYKWLVLFLSPDFDALSKFVM
jgi:hypothetical protein